MRGSASAPATIARGVAALAGGEVLSRLAAFAATALLARRLGPEGFGVVGFAAALSGYLALAINSGLHDVGTREVARAPDRAVDIYSSVATIRLMLAVAAFATLAVVAWALPKPPSTQLVVLLTGLSFFSFAIDPSWVLKGLERQALAGLGLILAQSMYAIGVVLLITGPGQVALVPVLQFIGELGAAALLCVILMRHTRPHVALSEGLRVLRSASYLGLARLLRTIVITFDVVLLGFLATDRDVGLYTAAYRFIFLLMSIAGAVATAYLPSYARVTSSGPDATRRLIEGSLGAATAVGAPLVAGAFVTAGPLLALLFGASYVEATPAFRVLLLSIGVGFLHYATLGNVLLAEHRTRLQAIIHGAAAAVNVALNLLLIPRFGILGSAAATLAAELTVVTAGLLVLRRMHAVPSMRPMIRPLAAAAVMSVIVWAAAPLPLVARMGLGAVVYGAALALMGGLPPAIGMLSLRKAS